MRHPAPRSMMVPILGVLALAAVGCPRSLGVGAPCRWLELPHGSGAPLLWPSRWVWHRMENLHRARVFGWSIEVAEPCFDIDANPSAAPSWITVRPCLLVVNLGGMLLLGAGVEQARRRWTRERWRRSGHCVRCGYDLAGNTSDRCPECGELHVRELSTPHGRYSHTVRGQQVGPRGEGDA